MGWSNSEWFATEGLVSKTWLPVRNARYSCWVWHFVQVLPLGTWDWTMSSCRLHKWSILQHRSLLWPSPHWSWANSITSSNTQPWCPSAWEPPSASWERSSLIKPAASLCSRRPCWGVSSPFSRVSVSVLFVILVFCCVFVVATESNLCEVLKLETSSHTSDIRMYFGVFPCVQQSAVLERFSDLVIHTYYNTVSL